MKFWEVVKSALHSLGSNKIRSTLTMLGIIIGISSVIIIAMVGKGSQNSITGELIKLADKVITINVQSNNLILTKKDYISMEDIEKIREIPGVSGVAPSLRDRARLAIKDNEFTAFSFLETTSEDFEEISGAKIVYGRPFSIQEVDRGEKRILIDDVYAMRKFGRIDVAGEELQVQLGKNVRDTYIISGVFENPMKNLMSSFGGREIYQIYIPYRTYQKYINDKPISSISVSISDVNSKDSISSDIVTYIEEAHQKEGIYEISAKTSPAESFNNILTTLSILLTAVATISLLVGGIGVMNIMLVSVTERIREIGIRKAIGGKRRDILLQFLIEAVFMSLTGGIIGVFLGIVISYIAGAFLKIRPVLDILTILISVIVSSGIGIVFGTYPAKRASELDPIEALRHE